MFDRFAFILWLHFMIKFWLEWLNFLFFQNSLNLRPELVIFFLILQRFNDNILCHNNKSNKFIYVYDNKPTYMIKTSVRINHY